MRRVKITKVDISAGKAQRLVDYVAEEKPLHIFLNEEHYVTIFCSPRKLKELAVGHLFSEGTIKSMREIEEINLAKEACCIELKPIVNLEKRLKHSKLHSRVILSACGSNRPYKYSVKLSKVKSSLRVRAKTILECVNRLNTAAHVFRKTGGVHVAAIYKADGTLVGFAEDVGRHNAVDKAIGIAALSKTDFGTCFLASSGRLTGDMVLKAARVGLPIIASLAAAIGSGISVAEETNLTLVGFARGKRMNVYSFPKRVIL
jgi:FdhD protein